VCKKKKTVLETKRKCRKTCGLEVETRGLLFWVAQKGNGRGKQGRGLKTVRGDLGGMLTKKNIKSQGCSSQGLQGFKN